MTTPPELDDIVTEARAVDAADLDLRSTRELVALMNDQDAGVSAAVAEAEAAIVEAIEAIAERLAGGGRLIYVGAGTSGGLATLDAAECHATFSTPPEQVTAVVAGADLTSALERYAAEDDVEAGRRDLEALRPGASDAVVGVSASGETPYVLSALRTAQTSGALTVALVCNRGSELGRLADREIAVVVGPEVVAGSTRLKAGTAQKLVLSMLSTISMVRLGKTFGNLMVDVQPANAKLRERVRRIVQAATGATSTEVEAAFVATNGNAKVAIVSLLADVDAETAQRRLESAQGNVRRALLR